MQSNNTREGENLRKIIVLRYGSLKKAANALGISYEHLTRECKKTQINDSFRANISQLLDLDPVTLAPKGAASAPPPPEKIDWQAEAIATLRKLQELQAKYIRLLEELRNGRK